MKIIKNFNQPFQKNFDFKNSLIIEIFVIFSLL